jgi:hypothetical protein
MVGGKCAGPQDFGAAFTALLDAAALTPDKIVSRLARNGVPISRSVLYDWKKGAHLPEDANLLLAVVNVCLAAAGDRRADLRPAPHDDGDWKRLLAQAKETRDSRAGRTRRAEPKSRRMGSVAHGRLIVDWDPVELGVHRAIGLKALPDYVPRRHDELLMSVLNPASMGSRLVVLRGGSSTGKSRAAYQAILERLPDWQVDYPRTAAALADRLGAGVAPRTVLWLDELRHYVDEVDGPRALTRLAELLAATGQVVAITCLWPEVWAA